MSSALTLILTSVVADYYQHNASATASDPIQLTRMLNSVNSEATQWLVFISGNHWKPLLIHQGFSAYKCFSSAAVCGFKFLQLIIQFLWMAMKKREAWQKKERKKRRKKKTLLKLFSPISLGNKIKTVQGGWHQQVARWKDRQIVRLNQSLADRCMLQNKKEVKVHRKLTKEGKIGTRQSEANSKKKWKKKVWWKNVFIVESPTEERGKVGRENRKCWGGVRC